ncbi:MAG: rRNA pseudouridine synthase [Planctomycetales bacterium]|nr:rRNA pseudouridine synthase [Planctomycetales bacterium]
MNSVPDEPVRLSKLMSERGLCSRREADVFISRGLVFVDGERIDTLGTKILPSQTITLARTASREQQELATILLNKPIGYVSGQPEHDYQPAVVLITPENQAQEFRTGVAFHPRQHLKGLAPAGRLDIDSKGLLVFTQDGRMARRLTGENSGIEKEYLVRVTGVLSDDGLQKLRHGLSLDGKPLKPAHVEWINADQLRFILTEGRHRQIRRMCEAVGLVVIGLKRVRIGQIKLGKLPEGEWRFLQPGEQF